MRTASDKVASVTSPASIVGGWVHLAGVLTKDKQIQLYVNGRLAASGEAPQLIPSDPAQALELGADDAGAVGEYQSPNKLLGTIDELRLYHGELTAQEIAALAAPTASGAVPAPKNAKDRR